MSELANLDMNLLKVLNILIEEQNVTRAGARLGRTQPAISNALNRLRNLLDDELLVRGAGGLALTPRAEALRVPLQQLMQLAGICLSEGVQFDPSTATGLIQIGVPDRLSLSVLPLLVSRLANEAPGLNLHVKTADRDQTISLFDNNEIELALGWPENLPSHLRSEWLFDEELVCVCRNGHPILEASKDFDYDALTAFPHLVVSSTGGRKAAFDIWLGERGIEREVKVAVGAFSAVPELLLASDMIGVFTKRLVGKFQANYGLSYIELPFDLGPLGHLMVWPTRFDGDEKHIWLRGLVRDICKN